MARNKDSDYLFISARIRALELKLLSRERQERMLEAKDASDAMKVLIECGYPDGDDLESVLNAERESTFKELYEFAPHKQLVDVFKIKYDYHNLKVLIKSEAMDLNAGYLLSAFGRYDEGAISDAYRTGDFSSMTEAMKRASELAMNTLATTGDPQLADFELDKSCYEEMLSYANDTKSSFLIGYVKLLIDVANLKAIVRAYRLGKAAGLLRSALIGGGSVDSDRILKLVALGQSVTELFSANLLKSAAELGAEAVKGGKQTAFERECENAVLLYLQAAKLVNYGDPILIAYLAAKEAELTAIRIIISGKNAGVNNDMLRERLRVQYV